MPTAPRIHRARPPQPRQDRRASAAERGYDSTWADFAETIRQRDKYLCQRCKQMGYLRPANTVDHIVPLHVAPHRRLDESNCQTLCRPCHAVKTHEDGRMYGRRS